VEFLWDIEKIDTLDGVIVPGAKEPVDGFISRVYWYLIAREGDSSAMVAGDCSWTPDEVQYNSFTSIKSVTEDDLVRMIVAYQNYYADPKNQNPDNPVLFHSIEGIKKYLRNKVKDNSSKIFTKLEDDDDIINDNEVE